MPAEMLEPGKGPVQAVCAGTRRGNGRRAGQPFGAGSVGARADGRGGQAPRRSRMAGCHPGQLPQVRRFTGQEFEILSRVRREACDCPLLQPMRRQAGRDRQVLQQLRQQAVTADISTNHPCFFLSSYQRWHVNPLCVKT